MAKQKILIADDEAQIREILRIYFEKEGFEVIEAEDGAAAILKVQSEKPDILLLDIMMPQIDGYDLLNYIRPTGTPCIFITAKAAVEDRVRGLHSGADDYIVKPLEMREVIARVRAIFRRLAPEDSGKISFDKLTVDKQAYDLIVDGKRVDAPPKEIELLYFLASNPNRVFTRAQLLDDVWGFDYFGDTRTVDVHVKRLREKLEGVSDKWDLKTVWGVGYKFETRD